MSSSLALHRRTIRDNTGVLWQIAEHDARDVPGAMSATCLVFDSQSICRRFWYYPADWLALGDATLLDLMSQPRAGAA
ncbi:MAG: hypothetical protein H0U66_06870 [Gemmatimonadaceae bacterium]|nr:hypothetical protein [Gemmatimonadaceae bacterium]